MNALGLKGTQVMCIYYLASNPEGLTAADLCTRSESNIKPSSKSYVGYVHAIAYSLGWEYNIPCSGSYGRKRTGNILLYVNGGSQ